MKKLYRIVSILLVVAMLPVVAFAQTPEEWNRSQGANHLKTVTLEVDGGYMRFRIPTGYQLQEYELSNIEDCPFSYVFIDESANSQFIVYSTLDTEKDQGIRLRKLYDKSNRNIVFENVAIGTHTYIVHTKEQASFDYGFLIREGNGYSYHFQYILPYDTIQNGIPEEAISILSTLEIQEFPFDNQVSDTALYNGYVVNLETDGGYLQLHIPIGYQLQEYELSDIEEYPFSYVFIDESANAQFIVYSSLDNEKDQGIRLRKLYDKSNKNIVFEDVVIGDHSYIVHTKEQASFDYGFLIQEGNGYSYHFQYILPYDTIQNEIPEEATSILSTLSIQEFPMHAD